jgi:dihydrofolate reductase
MHFPSRKDFSKMTAVIAAVANNGVIGNNGKIPWNLPQDMKHFQKLTMGNVVVMGRRTYEEIGHPLPNRVNYLVSSTLYVEGENCHTVSSLAEALEIEKKKSLFSKEIPRDIFICGGQMLYKEALPLADTLYLTELSFAVQGDTFFPEWNRNEFRLTDKKICTPQAWFCEYRRILK